MFKYKNFVFEGCGVKSGAYLGVLKKLDELGLLVNMQRVGGASAGGIVSFLLSLGEDVEGISRFLWTTDLSKFADSGNALFSSYRFIRYFGLHSGNYFLSFVKDKLIEHLGDPDLTFEELKEANIGPDLFLVGSNVSTRNYEVFSHMTTPLMPIATAMRITMSIPFYYQAVKYKGSVYTDGGVLCNWPITLFDDERFYTNESTFCQMAGHPEIIYNTETLGFKIDSDYQISTFGDRSKLTKHSVKTLPHFIYGLIDSLINTQETTHLNHPDWHRMIQIPNCGIGTTQFNLSREDLQKLINAGYQATSQFFDHL